MKQTILDQATSTLSDGLMLLLAGMGVSIAGNEYVGGCAPTV